jgi:hypothetical protein
VAHLTEGTLRRMVDDPDSKNSADARHFESCADCQGRYKAVADDAGSIATLLAAPELKVDTAAAFKRVLTAPAAQPRFGFRLPVLRPGSRPMMLAFAAAAALVALLATAIAENGTVFAPSTVTPVPVTVADLQSLSQLSDYGTFAWTTQPQLQVVTSAADAASATGLKVPTVKNLPPGVSSTVTYGAMSKATAVFTFSAAKAAAAAAKTGKPLPKLPAGADGAQLTVTVGPAVAEIFGNFNKPGSSSDISQANLPQLIVAASSAPIATSTQLTVKQMESYLLAQPGLSPELAAAIKGIGDPSTTLPIPIPIQYATSTTVTVQGVKGVALGDNTGVGSGVIWVKNGVVYVVAGTVKQSDAIDIANHLS